MLFDASYYIRFQLFSIMIFICISSCIYDLNLAVGYSNNILYRWNKHRQLISAIQHYQIQGNVVYTINSNKKTYIKFLWIKYDNNHYNIKLFNIFGLTILSICIKQDMIHVVPHIMYHNNDLINKIQQWFMQTNFFEKQLQKWIIGLPGDNTKYHLNNVGYLSDINYEFDDENISILYRHYYTDITPALPSSLEVFYNKYFIKLHINYWSLL